MILITFNIVKKDELPKIMTKVCTTGKQAYSENLKERGECTMLKKYHIDKKCRRVGWLKIIANQRRPFVNKAINIGVSQKEITTLS
jgi:hypothetical protein